MQKLLGSAKAVAAFVGSIITALLGVLPPAQYHWLVILGVVATTITTWAVPNKAATPGVPPITPVG
jgi:hypothetical protein